MKRLNSIKQNGLSALMRPEEQQQNKEPARSSMQQELQAKRVANLEQCLIPVPLMFVHLAKTAGTALFKSFRFSFLRQSNREVVQFWDAGNPDFWRAHFLKTTQGTAPMLIGGHLAHGFHRVNFADEQENSQFSYITFLRHPVKRVWSHYTYHRGRPQDPNWIFAQNKTFEQWLASMEFGKDAMTAYLSGAVPGAWWNVGTKIPELSSRPNPEKPDIMNPNPLYNVTEKHYRLAVANLKRMAFVGLHEKMGESVDMLGRLLGLKIRVQPLLSRSIPEGPSPQQIELIEKYNRFDLLLYQEAELLYQQQSDLLAISCVGKNMNVDLRRRYILQ